MMKEGASAPPRPVSMTVNPILSTNCATKQTTTTNERKEGKKEERKDDTFLPAIDNSYTHPRYSSYVVDTTTGVQESASELVMHHPTTTVSDCTVPYSTGSSDPTSTVTTLYTATFTMVTDPTMNPTNAPPTATKFTVLLPTVTTATVTDPTVTDSNAINSTVTLLPTVLPLYDMTTTTSNVPTARANNSMTYMTMTQYNPMKATLYQCKLMILAMFFPHYSHPPYYA